MLPCKYLKILTLTHLSLRVGYILVVARRLNSKYKLIIGFTIFSPRVSKVLDLKTPDSGESHRNLYENIQHLTTHDQVKFVICSRRDYDWARFKVDEGARQNGEAWQVGIEKPDSEGQASGILAISSGALATSGDSKRFLLKEGVRYSHILNPSTGWPITDAPRSVTVAAPTCIEAGMMATFASLQGEYAEQFLEAMDTPYWCLR